MYGEFVAEEHDCVRQVQPGQGMGIGGPKEGWQDDDRNDALPCAGPCIPPDDAVTGGGGERIRQYAATSRRHGNTNRGKKNKLAFFHRRAAVFRLFDPDGRSQAPVVSGAGNLPDAGTDYQDLGTRSVAGGNWEIADQGR